MSDNKLLKNIYSEYKEIKQAVADRNWDFPVSDHSINIVILICSLIILIAIISSCTSNQYIGGVSGTVKVYMPDEEGNPEYFADIPRGIKVKTTGETVELNDEASTEADADRDNSGSRHDADNAGEGTSSNSDGMTILTGIKVTESVAEAIPALASNSEDTSAEDGLDSKKSDDDYDSSENTDLQENIAPTIIYIPAENIVKSRDDIIQETELYVRTPVTVYENEEGPEIQSYLSKGTHMDIVEAGELQDTGFVDKYKVAYTDADGKKNEGYVYGKYLVGTQEEADVNYNLNGEYDAAVKAEYGFDLGGGHARNLDYYPVEKPSFDDNELCTNARTMYINCYAAVHPDSYIDVIEETDCNAVVIDIKDGQLAYKSAVAKDLSPTAYKGAYVSEDEYKAGVDAYKDAGVYTIGRIVVFNDSAYAKDHPEDCIRSGSGTNWPSGYSRAVWEYNVRLAIEAVEKFGFNEIQFDYVRFPESSYEMSESGDTDFRNTYGEEKAQAIQGFCYYACDQLHERNAYVSVDVFGECSYTYVTAYGQYWPAISNIVDAISSMPYADHHGENDTWTHPYKTLNTWAKRTADRQAEVPTPAVDRTWITGYNTPYWNPTVSYNTEKMQEQIKALTDAGLKGGFIPWNAASDVEKYRQYQAIWNESAE